MTKVVQVSFSEEDYMYINKVANDKGITVQMLIKQSVLPRREYDEAFEKLIDMISKLEPEEEFTIRELFSTEWKRLTKGTRLSLGRCFFQSIEKGLITNVKPLNKKDSTHSQIYIKLG